MINKVVLAFFDEIFAPLRLCEKKTSRKGAKAQRGWNTIRMNGLPVLSLFVIFMICFQIGKAQDKPNRQAAMDSTARGLEDYTNESLDEALKLFDAALKVDSTYQEARYRRANVYVEQNNPTLALRDYQWLINHKTHNPDVYERMGDMDTAKQDFKSALPMFSMAIAIDSSQGSYFAARGLTLFFLEKYDKAAIDLDKAVGMNFTSADIYSKLGYAQLRSGDDKGAAFNFTKAIQLNPTNYEDYANRGDALVALHLLYEAKEDLLYYMTIDSLDYSIWYNLARADYGLNQYDSSIAAYKKVNRLKPGYGDTYFRMALVYGDKGDYKNAIAAFSMAIEEYPKDAYLYYNRAIARAKLNDGSDYCADLKIAADMNYELAADMMRKVCR